MKSLFASALVVAIALTSSSYGGVIDVTVDVTTLGGQPVQKLGDTYQITVGGTFLFSVFGQVVPAQATANNGIFGWDVDLTNSDPSIVTVNAATVDRSGWTGGSTSSSGIPMPWGIDAIYDTQELVKNSGLGSPVRLFSVQFTGVNAGISTLVIGPDFTSGVDFVTQLGGTDGNYSIASANVNAVPEPSTFFLLSVAVGTVVLARRIRRK